MMATSPVVVAPQKPLEDPLAHLPCSTIVEYRKGQMIYNQDQPSTSIYLVIDGKVKRGWDEAQTPYARLLATGAIGPEQQERLQQLYLQTNPLVLRQEIYERLTALWEQQLSPEGTAA